MADEPLNGFGQQSGNEQQTGAAWQNQQPQAAPSSTAAWQAPVGSAAGSTWQPGSQQATSWQAPVGGAPGGQGGPKKPRTGLKTFGIGVVGGLVSCALVLGVGFGTGALGGTTTIGATSSAPITASDDSETLANQVADKALPSVASIDVYTEQGGWYSMFGQSSDSELVESSLGSGVVLSADGYIVTNNHVVEGGSAYRVTVDGQTFDADLVGTDPSSDLAVLKCKDASGLTPIELGDSDAIQIGDWVMTIGSPFGLESSVATGIVSATNRSQVMSSNTDGSTTIYTNLIQTDAAINPGNSGGALVDDQGRLIGLNTLITSSSGNYSGVGFAIPVNYAVGIAEQIINGETPTHAQLGVRMVPVTAESAQMYGFSVDSGAYVSSVDAGSGAEAGGIKQGDIITAIDGEQIESTSDLTIAVRSHNPGDTVTITVNRDGESMDLEVTLGESSDDEQQAETQQQSDSGSGSLQDLLDRFYGGQGF